MIIHLQELYGKQTRTAHFDLSKQLFNMKMREEQSVHDHCMTMIKNLEELEKLELSMQRELKVDLILQSLTSSFGQFIINYHMNKLDCNLSELINMLVTIEGTLKNSRGSVLVVERAPSKRKS